MVLPSQFWGTLCGLRQHKVHTIGQAVRDQTAFDFSRSGTRNPQVIRHITENGAYSFSEPGMNDVWPQESWAAGREWRVSKQRSFAGQAVPISVTSLLKDL